MRVGLLRINRKICRTAARASARLAKSYAQQPDHIETFQCIAKLPRCYPTLPCRAAPPVLFSQSCFRKPPRVILTHTPPFPPTTATIPTPHDNAFLRPDRLHLVSFTRRPRSFVRNSYSSDRLRPESYTLSHSRTLNFPPSHHQTFVSRLPFPFATATFFSSLTARH